MKRPDFYFQKSVSAKTGPRNIIILRPTSNNLHKEDIMNERKTLTQEFRKSSFSGDGGCVQVASREGKILVRDSKDQDGPALTFSAEEWHYFIKGVKAREFEL
jgi:hypothetical protein